MTKAIHTVFIQIDPPKGRHPGRVAEGCYIVEDGVLVLTDRKGNPARDDNGHKYTHKIADGDNAKQIAAWLTKELRKALRGNGAAPRGFGSSIDYPKSWTPG